ncbi:MAG: hypothetical protein KUG81_06615 [Gammaproteobacteria bacterium]|nr:hypothetical protein [Gammaproteobacteria bacterium]
MKTKTKKEKSFFDDGMDKGLSVGFIAGFFGAILLGCLVYLLFIYI